MATDLQEALARWDDTWHVTIEDVVDALTEKP